MRNPQIGRPVVIVLLLAVLTGCAASKEYTSKIFPAQPVSRDTQAVALRFLEIEGLSGDESDWVSTHIITGRDTVNQSLALDNLSKVFPAKKDSVKPVVVTGSKNTAAPEVAKSRNGGEVRQKRTRE